MPKSQIRGGCVEVRFCRCLNPISKVAVENLIKIQLQHLFLGVTTRDFCREDDLACLTLVGLHKAFVRQQQHARQLLGDRGSARNDLAGSVVGIERAR